jgi:hypothetical protein
MSTYRKFPAVTDQASDGGNILVTTLAGGSTFASPDALPIVNATVFNSSGTAIDMRQDATGAVISIPNGAVYTIRGVDDASRLGFRRTDLSVTPVSFGVRWER